MATLPKSHPEYWPQERVGYEDRRTIAYAPGDTTRLQVFKNWTAWEARLGNMVATVGVIWAASIYFTSATAGLNVLWQTTGPRATAALGLLLWLHAKWQRSVTLR